MGGTLIAGEPKPRHELESVPEKLSDVGVHDSNLPGGFEPKIVPKGEPSKAYLSLKPF